jgi:TonB family protein
MLGRQVCVSIAALLFSAALPAEPLQPLKPWVVNYDVVECTAQRAYGNPENPIYLALGPSAWGNTYELIVATKGKGPEYAEETKGSVDFGQGPINAWLLHYALKKATPLDVVSFRISEAEIGQAASARSVTFHVSGRPDISFSLASIPALIKTLQDCTTDLQHYWNIVDPEQKNIAAPAKGDLRQLFSWKDYPGEALYRNQEGEVRFLLFVNEKGKVAACHVLQPSGIPVLDGMGCQIMIERARFLPALDKQGVPIRSAIVTPPIRWRLN